MTVSNTYDEQVYVASGEAVSFAWSSDYDDTFGTLVVTQLDENGQEIKTFVEGQDYFIKNKRVYFYEAPTQGTIIKLDRYTYRGQEVTFIEGEDFPAKDYETSLDRLFMIEQEQDKGLADETAARIAADIALQENIDAETEARIAADTEIQNSIGNGTITLTQGGETKGTFTTNQSGNTTIALDAGGGMGGREGISIKHISAIYTSVGGIESATINVVSYVEEGKAYYPIVSVYGQQDADYRDCIAALDSCCVYEMMSKTVRLWFSNDFNRLNSTTYVVTLVPIDLIDSAQSTYCWGITNGAAYTQSVSNLVTSISSSSTDTQYPSAKCVYDIVGDIETLLQSV